MKEKGKETDQVTYSHTQGIGSRTLPQTPSTLPPSSSDTKSEVTQVPDKKWHSIGNFLVVQWLGLCNSTAWGPGLIPDWGTNPSSPAVRLKIKATVFAHCELTLWASLVAQIVKNPPAVQETQVWALGWEDPLEKGMATHSSILAWRIPWRETWWAKSHGVTKSQTRLGNFCFFTFPYAGFIYLFLATPMWEIDELQVRYLQLAPCLHSLRQEMAGLQLRHLQSASCLSS